MFFPEENEPGVPPAAAAACAGCPVADPCLRSGIAENTHGVWGGVRLDDVVLTDRTRPLPPLAALVPILLALHRAAGARRYSAPEIAVMLGIEKQTARANLHALEAHGIVDRHPQNNPRPDLYELHDGVDIAEVLVDITTWTTITRPPSARPTRWVQLQFPAIAAIPQVPVVLRPRCPRHRPPIEHHDQPTIYDYEELSA